MIARDDEVADSAGTATATRCSRCGTASAESTCPTCQLVLSCPHCGKSYDAPGKQRICGHCVKPVPASPAWVASADSGGLAPEAAPLALVADLVAAIPPPGFTRRAGVNYALALLADERLDEVDPLLVRLLDEPGSEPSRGALLALRAYVAERSRDYRQAVELLLDTAAEQPECADAAAARAHLLLAAPGAELARSWLAGSGSARFRARPDLALHAALLGLRAAVLAVDGAAADSALAATMQAGPGTRKATRALLDELAASELDGRQRLLLGQLRWQIKDGAGALHACELALVLDLPDDGGRLGVAAAHHLRGDILSAEGSAQAAAAAYLDAGMHFIWADAAQRAVETLDRSLGCHETAEAQIVFAEALRRVAGETPAPDRGPYLDRALTAWHRGVAILDGRPETWMFEIGALTIDALSELDVDRARERFWSAVLIEEQGLAADDQSPTLWSLLARHHRSLDNYATGLLAAQEARKIDPDDGGILVEALVLEAYTGRSALLDTFAVLREKLEEMGEDLPPWLHAFVLVQSDRCAEAVELLTCHVDDEPAEEVIALITRFLLADSLQKIGAGTDARRHWQMLWDDRYRVFDSAMTSVSATAGFWLGEYAETELLLRRRLNKAPAAEENAVDLRAMLAVVLLAQGRPEEATEAFESGVAVRAQSDAEGNARALEELARRLTATDPVSAGLARDWASTMSALAERLRDAPYGVKQAIEELHAANQHADDYRSVASVVRFAAQAGLARLLIADGCHGEALDVLVELAGCTKQNAWVAQRLGQLALPLMGAGSTASAAKAVASARAALPEDADADRQIATWWRRCLRDREALWAIADRLGPDAPHELTGPLWRCHDLFLEIDSDSFPIVTTILPIVLEISDDLVPEDTSDTGPLIGTDIPAMRDRIESETGVWIPGVRVRVSPDLPPGGFQMWVHESDFATGTVPADRTDLPVGEDPLLYVLGRLERHIRNHLARFLTPDEVGRMLGRREDWDAPPVAIRLGRLLRDLASDQVPLRDVEAVLGVATPGALVDVPLPVLVDRCRAALRLVLPGNADGQVRVAVPASLASGLVAAVSSGAVPPALALTAMKTTAVAAQEGYALVTPDAPTRHLLRRLQGGRYPEVALLHATEALSPVIQEQP